MHIWQGAAELTILEWLARAAFFYALLFFLLKLMGQRELGRAKLFDFVIVITVGSIAAGPLRDSELALTGAVVTIMALSAFEIVLAWLGLKWSKFRRVIEDEPLILVRQGKVLDAMMRRARFNLDDLLSELRLKDCPNIMDVDYAILEPNGRISVIKRAMKSPVTPADLGLQVAAGGLPAVVIEDGNILADNLERSGHEPSWLERELSARGIDDPGEVFLGVLDSRGGLFLDLRDAKETAGGGRKFSRVNKTTLED